MLQMGLSEPNVPRLVQATAPNALRECPLDPGPPGVLGEGDAGSVGEGVEGLARPGSLPSGGRHRGLRLWRQPHQLGLQAGLSAPLPQSSLAELGIRHRRPPSSNWANAPLAAVRSKADLTRCTPLALQLP